MSILAMVCRFETAVYNVLTPLQYPKCPKPPGVLQYLAYIGIICLGNTPTWKWDTLQTGNVTQTPSFLRVGKMLPLATTLDFSSSFSKLKMSRLYWVPICSLFRRIPSKRSPTSVSCGSPLMSQKTSRYRRMNSRRQQGFWMQSWELSFNKQPIFGLSFFFAIQQFVLSQPVTCLPSIATRLSKAKQFQTEDKNVPCLK